MDNKTNENFDPERDNNQTHNVAKLVIVRNLDIQETISFIMIFVGEYNYLKSTKTIDKNGYLYRQSDFTGDLLFYSTQGDFLNGWRYKSGAIVATLALGTELGFKLSSTVTRGMVCHTEVMYINSFECWSGTYYDPEFGWGPSVTCTPISIPYYYEVCDWIEEATPGTPWDPNRPGSAGSSGGSSGGGVIPPSDEKKTFNPKAPLNVLNDPGLAESILRMWNEALTGASKILGRREVGAWIYYDSISKKYYIGDFKYGDYVKGEGSKGTITVSSPQSSLNGDHIPRTSETISYIHSHTPLIYESAGFGRPVGPSREDLDYAEAYQGYTFYVIDYIGRYNNTFGGNAINGGISVDEPMQIYIYDRTGVIETKPLK